MTSLNIKQTLFQDLKWIFKDSFLVEQDQTLDKENEAYKIH